MTPPIATTSAELHRLCALVNRARHAAIWDGMTPTEVWIGPEHHGLLRDTVAADAVMDRTIARVKGKDELLCGLKVRLSAEPGVWVGQTFGVRP